MSGAYTPRSEAERAAVVALVDRAMRHAFDAGRGMSAGGWLGLMHEPESQVPPVPQPETRTRTVPRVYRFGGIVSGPNNVITYSDGCWRAVCPGYPDNGAWDRLHGLLRAFPDIPDDDVPALLDLKANPTETITEPIAHETPAVFSTHAFLTAINTDLLRRRLPPVENTSPVFNAAVCALVSLGILRVIPDAEARP